MSRIEEILAKLKAHADELEMAKQEERDALLKDIEDQALQHYRNRAQRSH